ncbi:g8835 [Coccomyxa viridis]|uniref:G8835 protein n=1 Tax=Coccomyxa viridis TaxID=1274662 RepID=A0ABP1G2G9_9CHLO
MGRPVGSAEQQLIERLESNWYSTAADVVSMSEAEAQSLRIPMRLLTVLKESLQAALPANGTASMQSLASSGLPQQLSLELNALPESLPGIKAEPKATRRRSATKAAQLLEAAQRQQQQQSSSASDPQLNGSSRSVRTMEKAHLSGLHTPAESIFHGPVNPLRAAEELQSSSAANLNGAHSQQQLETEQAFEAPQTVLESSGSKAQALLEQASGAGTAEAAVEQEAAEVATCAEALSIALSGNAEVPQTEIGLPGLIQEIQNRRCPPMGRFKHGSSCAVKVTKHSRRAEYTIREEQMSADLKQDFEDFMLFCTKRQWQQQHEPIATVTAKQYTLHLRRALGWLAAEQEIPLEELRLKNLLPSSDRAGVHLAFDYSQFLLNERQVSPFTQGLAVRSILQAAKFLYGKESSTRPDEGEKSYNDLLIVRELRKMSSLSKRGEKTAPRVSEEELKWLNWPDFVQVVKELRRECAGKDNLGRARSSPAVAWSLQRYLIFAILCCIPDRQRTIRELEVGKTLFKEGERWVIKHQADDYKTGRAYGQRPPMVIAPHIYPELEAFLGHWRQFLQPQHSLVFSQLNGAPMTMQAVYKIFHTSAFRVSGKKTNPHLVRDMVVTYLRGSGASERELEALAIYMGHSLEMQRGSYDRRTKAAKVEPAIELLASLYNQNKLAA